MPHGFIIFRTSQVLKNQSKSYCLVTPSVINMNHPNPTFWLSFLLRYVQSLQNPTVLSYMKHRMDYFRKDGEYIGSAAESWYFLFSMNPEIRNSYCYPARHPIVLLQVCMQETVAWCGWTVYTIYYDLKHWKIKFTCFPIETIKVMVII
jgi:hypothetical protein